MHMYIMFWELACKVRLSTKKNCKRSAFYCEAQQTVIDSKRHDYFYSFLEEVIKKGLTLIKVKAKNE